MSDYNDTGMNSSEGQPTSVNAMTAELSLGLYSVIFVLSVVGNILVILTLIREKKMRTITNMFLLNLAVSDMLLSVLCMPFTLVAVMLLRNFIFGEAMCIIIRYFQAVSVGVSCYTLVAISLEQYYAICQPLESRQWQTLSHARKMILGIWASILLLMSPIAAFQRLIPIKTGVHACREIWPNSLLTWNIDQVYSVVLAVVLLLVPLLLMSGYYGLIAKRLWMGDSGTSKAGSSGNSKESQKSFRHNNSYSEQNQSLMLTSSHYQRDLNNRKRIIRMLFVVVLQYFVCWAPSYIRSFRNSGNAELSFLRDGSSGNSKESQKSFGHNNSYSEQNQSLMLTSSHYQRDLNNRKRIIRMLFVVVLQYFVCWAPSYILSTWESIDFHSVLRMISPTTKSLILLLAYTSSFIHPITYCFMNQNFRRGFLKLMPCISRLPRHSSLRVVTDY